MANKKKNVKSMKKTRNNNNKANKFNSKDVNEDTPEEEEDTPDESGDLPKSLQIKHVLHHGGDKKDLQFLEDLTDDEEEDFEYDPSRDDETYPVKHDEITAMLESLNIVKYRPEYMRRKEKKSKEHEESEYSAEDTIADARKAKEKLSKSSVQQQDAKEVLQNKEEPIQAKKKKSKNKFKVQDSEVSSTVTSDNVEEENSDDSDDDTEQPGDMHSLLKYIKSAYQKRNYLLIRPDSWQKHLEKENVLVQSGTAPSELSTLEQFAQQVLTDDTDCLRSKKSASAQSEMQWLKTVIKTGTLADKMSALSSQVQQDAVHYLSSLEMLVGMVTRKDRRRECVSALDNLTTLFIKLLPNQRKLRKFSEMPFSSLATISGGNHETQDRQLALWYYESQLKNIYEDFVEALISVTFDTVQASKLKGLKGLLDLLIAKPEQEAKLLTGLVNKLGDPDRTIAAKVSHLLSTLVGKHPNMKGVIVSEVETILYRSNINPKAQYYAICFMNQMLLSKDDTEIAVKLLTIYFSFFKALIKKHEVDSKLMSALLVGVYRAFPFAKDSDTLNLDEQVNAIYKVVHAVKFNTCIQALTLLYHVCDGGENISDRFYIALYRKLLDPELKTTSKQSMFLNLLYKSMKKDYSDRRCKAFIKRLLQIASFHQPTFTCSALIILSELLKHRPGIINFLAVFNEDDSDIEVFKDEDSEDEEKDLSQEKENCEQSERKSWVHSHSQSGPGDYSGSARNPLYCASDKAIETELITLTHHYHPSVVVFATILLNGKSIDYGGDPLNDFSLNKFLDRFVFRNPKKVTDQDGAPKPLARSKMNIKDMAVNSAQFMNMDSKKVPEDQRFFHSYFKSLNSSKLLKSKQSKKVDIEDGEEVNDDDFDKFLSKYEASLISGKDSRFDDGDFANDFKKGRSKKKKGDEDNGDSESDDSDDYLDDEEPFDLNLDDVDFGVDEFEAAGLLDDPEDKDDIPDQEESLRNELKGEMAYSDEINEEDIEFSDDDDDFKGLDFSTSEKSSKKSARKRFGKFSGSLVSTAGDEFGDLMDEADYSIDTTSTNAVVNAGKVGAKQLGWEKKREQRHKPTYTRKRGSDGPGKRKSTASSRTGRPQVKRSRRK